MGYKFLYPKIEAAPENSDHTGKKKSSIVLRNKNFCYTFKAKERVGREKLARLLKSAFSFHIL